MAYNPYPAVNALYKLKGQWDNANNAGDTDTKNSVAAKAQEYYKQLRDNDYGDIADELTASNYAQAKVINDKWAKMGKTSTRDYLYSLGQSKGMSQSDVDKLISWDNLTGEVSFGGKKIGTPDSVVDGVSYWSDTSVLDNAFNDYINRSGTTPSNAILSSQNSAGVQNKINESWGLQTSGHSDLTGLYKQEYEDLKNTNPFETETGKAILAKYDLSALQGRDNAVANGAGSNSGNIDSFAAANAMRQQASLINQGQMAAIDAHQQKLDHARALLSDMGISMQNDYKGMQNTIGLQQNEAQRLFENDENSKNNEAARQDIYSGITGTVSDTVTKLMNGNIWDENGSLKNANVDFQAQINDLETALNSTTDANERARIKEQLRVLEAARNQKIDEQGLSYGKTYKYQGAPETYTAQKDKADRESAERITNAGIASEERINAANNANVIEQIKTGAEYSTTKPTLTAEQAQQAIKDGIITDATVAAFNHYFGGNYTVANPPKIGDDTPIDENGDGVDEYPIYTKWNNAGISLQNVSVSKPDKETYLSRVADLDIDEYGVKAIDSVYTAVANGILDQDKDGQVTNYEVADFLIANSNDNDTNINQLKKVFAYFGLNNKMLDEVRNVRGEGDNWRYGVEYKK